MADCDGVTLSVPDLNCEADLPTWATSLVSELQAAVDHIISCIVDFEYPQCDICTLKDDLVDCPLDCDMIDFTDITYGDSGGVCQLPYPSQAGLDFRYGSVRPSADADYCVWESEAVTFDTPFDSSCYGVQVTPTAMHEGVFEVGDVVLMVKDKTTTGFTIWYMLGTCEDEAASEDISFDYLAYGT